MGRRPLLAIVQNASAVLPSNVASVHDALASLYENILLETNSPALALQAILTRISQAFYYLNLPRENNTKEAEVVFSTTAFIPTCQRGLLSVAALLAVHLLAVLAITIAFISRTRQSLLGNSWQAVSQVTGEDIMSVLDVSTEMPDKDVTKWLKTTTGGQELHARLRRRHDGQVKLKVEMG